MDIQLNLKLLELTNFNIPRFNNIIISRKQNTYYTKIIFNDFEVIQNQNQINKIKKIYMHFY
jgi:hypothetical protein